MLSVLAIVEDTTVDGPGFRTAIYAAGCPNHCPGCHNPESWDIHRGSMMQTEEIVERILADEFADVTFSGGDPMFQPEGFTELAQAIKARSSKNIWCYTGYTFEALLRNPAQRQLLEQIVAKLGLPPFWLGLSWSSTERMSSQQSDLLTGELEFYRRLLTPVLTRIAGLFLRTQGCSPAVTVNWLPISLQDETEEATARLTRARAEELERKLAAAAGKEVKE